MISNCHFGFLVADMQLIRGWLVGWSIEVIESKSDIFYTFCVCLTVGWIGVWKGVGCPCPAVRNKFVTSRHLFINDAQPFFFNILKFCILHFNKAGYMATLVMQRCAGAVMVKVTGAYGQEQ